MDGVLVHLPDNEIVAAVSVVSGRSFGDVVAVLRGIAMQSKEHGDRLWAFTNQERVRLSNERVRREEDRQAARDAARGRR